MERSFFKRRFISEDLPTFGLPRITTLHDGSSFSSAGICSGSCSRIASKRSAIPIPCCAEIVISDANPRRSNSCICALAIDVSILFTTNTTDLFNLWSSLASSRSSCVIPTVPSQTNRTNAAFSTTSSARVRASSAIGSSTILRKLIPPVSASSNQVSRQQTSSVITSRVTPS